MTDPVDPDPYWIDNISVSPGQWYDGGGVQDCWHLSRHPAQALHLAVCRQGQAGRSAAVTSVVL